MEQFIEFLRTDNVLIIFAILLMVLFIGFLILLIRTAKEKILKKIWKIIFIEWKR